MNIEDLKAGETPQVPLSVRLGDHTLTTIVEMSNGDPLEAVKEAIMDFYLALGLDFGCTPAGPGGPVPIPAASLTNMRVTGLGDSRIERPRLMSEIRGQSLKIVQAEDEPTFGVGGYTIRQANGLDGGTDLVGGFLEGEAAICLVLLGVNSTSGGTLADHQASVTACMTRLDSVPVAISGASGTFTRDTSGALADVGDAATDGSGGTGTVVHVNAAGTVAWVRDVSGLASGAAITGVNSGWSAVLAEDPPAHSGRLIAVISEYPADTRGQVHKDYADWLDTQPFTDSLTFFRAIKVMDALADYAAATPTYPLPYAAGMADDELHLSPYGATVAATTVGATLDAVLANYPSQYPAYAVPAGVAAVDISGDKAPPTGATTPTGWQITDVTVNTGGFVDLEGADGDPDRVLSFGIEEGAYAGDTSPYIRAFLHNPYVVPSGGRDYRYGFEYRITNRAGDGPPVGFSSFRPQMYFPDGTFEQPTITVAPDGWYRFVTQDKAQAAAESGWFLFQPRLYVTGGGAVDAAVRLRRIGLWELG